MLLFLVDLINIEKFRISFRFFYLFSFILRGRATSVWYQSLTSIRDQVISICFKFLIRDQNFLFVRFGTVLCVTKFTNPTTFDHFHYSLYPTTLLGLPFDRSVTPALKLNTTATSIDVAASTRIEIVASPRIETVAPEVATTSFDLCGYYFTVIRDSHHSF